MCNDYVSLTLERGNVLLLWHLLHFWIFSFCVLLIVPSLSPPSTLSVNPYKLLTRWYHTFPTWSYFLVFCCFRYLLLFNKPLQNSEVIISLNSVDGLGWAVQFLFGVSHTVAARCQLGAAVIRRLRHMVENTEAACSLGAQLITVDQSDYT